MITLIFLISTLVATLSLCVPVHLTGKRVWLVFGLSATVAALSAFAMIWGL